MSDHPEFPQESPAIKYIVHQVSKVEDASNCATGYYKSLGKIISRLDKTDVELNRLHQTTTDLKKVTDSNVVASVIGKKSDEMNDTLYKGIITTSTLLSQEVGARMDGIRADHTAVISNINATNRQIDETIKRLDDHIKDVNTRIIPPLWKLWLYLGLSLVIGIIIGKVA